MVGNVMARTSIEKERGWSRWSVGSRESIRPTANHQAEYAQRVARTLNGGVLQDAVALGLEAQGQFKVDALDVLDALESAGLRLADDEPGEVSEASVALIDGRRRSPVPQASSPHDAGPVR